MSKLIFSILMLVSFCLTNTANGQMHNLSVSAIESQELLENGAILVDVREDEELIDLTFYSEGMLHIPLSQLETRIAELPKDKTLIIACKSGNRSARAIKVLENSLPNKLFNLEGGIIAWQAAGYPLVVNGVPPVNKSCGSKKGSSAKACCSSNKDSCLTNGKEKTKSSTCNEKPKSACCSKKSN
jgi:rhodanese-related sulfurtransferase